MYSDTVAATVRFATGMGIMANAMPSQPASALSWVIQAGALGLLAWYFLRVEPQQRREEREARREELELLLDHRDRDARERGHDPS